LPDHRADAPPTLTRCRALNLRTTREFGVPFRVVSSCHRCNTALDGERYCPTCGVDLQPDQPRLPTPGSFEAATREQAWLGGHPVVAREIERERDERKQREERERAGRLTAVQPRRFGEYRDLRGRELAARALLVATLGLAVVGAYFEVIHIGIVSDIRDGESTEYAVWEASDARLGFVYIATTVSYLLASIPFIVWLHRARRNLEALGIYDVTWSPGWAIGGWFVPILSLWRPKQVMNEVWRASDPGLPHGARAREWSQLPLSWVVTAWWALFIVGGFLDRIAGRMYSNATTPDAEISATTVSLVASVMTAAAALLAIQVVRQVTRRQRTRAARIRELPAPGESSATPPAAAVV
jgi:hypothetical protein